MKKKKILYITNTDPYSVDFGASQRSNAILKALLDLNAQIEIAYIGLESERTERKIKDEEIVFWNVSKSYKESKWNKFLRNLTIRYYPRFSNISIPIRKIISDGQYDCIIVRYLPMVYLCEIYDQYEKLIIDLDDYPLVSVKNSLQGKSDIFHNIYGHFQIQRAKRETELLLQNARTCYLANKDDAERFSTQYLPNISLNKTDEIVFKQDCKDILFIGRLDYYPNFSGVDHFIRTVWPEIKKRHPESNLLIAGAGLDESKSEEWESVGKVRCLGFVKDISEFYGLANVVVCPIYTGSGTNIKCIEALSMGKAVVMTPFASKGISGRLKNNENCLIPSSDEEMSIQLNKLLDDVDLCKKLQHNGLKLAQDLYSISSLTNILKDVINE